MPTLLVLGMVAGLAFTTAFAGTMQEPADAYAIGRVVGGAMRDPQTGMCDASLLWIEQSGDRREAVPQRVEVGIRHADCAVVVLRTSGGPVPPEYGCAGSLVQAAPRELFVRGSL